MAESNMAPLDFVIFDDANKYSKKKCNAGIIKTVSYSGENIKVCMPKNTPKSEREDLVYLILYFRDSDISHGYWQDEGKNRLLLLTKNDAHHFLVEAIDTSIIDENENIEDIIDNHFFGEAVSAIDLSPKAIKKEFADSNKKRIFLLAAIIIMGAATYQMLFVEDTSTVVKAPPPKPIPKPLSIYEKAKLKNHISMQIIDALDKEIEKFRNDSELLRRKRIISLGVSSVDPVPPVEPRWDEDRNRWYYAPSDWPRRGGFRAVLSLVKQKNYPGIGYSLDSTSRYSIGKTGLFYNRSDSEVAKNDERDLSRINDTKMVLNKSCLLNVLSLDKMSLPVKRSNRSIEIEIEDASPSDLLIGKLRRIVERCPFSIDRMELNKDGLLALKGTLYRRGK